MTHQGGLARGAHIAKLVWHYRTLWPFVGVETVKPDNVSSETGMAAVSPENFVRELEALGPTFVKLGQTLSTRPDMIPPEYAKALERMQEGVLPVPFDQMRGVFEAEFGRSPRKLFAEFDETPIGCASLAQVYRAALRDGSPVAVKIQRPGIAAELVNDLEILSGFARTADNLTDLGRRIHFADWLDEFRKALLAELDYGAEAENLERFGQRLSVYPELVVPKPVWDLTRSRVLTMQLVEGIRVDRIPGVRRTETDMQPVAVALMRGYLDQFFIHGEIHADPHPGNLRLLEDGRLAIFDLGMMAHVPPKLRDRLLKLVFAAVDGRGEQVAEETIGMGTRLEEFEEERYIREIGQRIAQYVAHSGTSSEGRVMLDAVTIATSCGLRTPPQLSLLAKTLLNLDAVCKALAPELDVKEVLEGHLQEIMKGRLRKSLSSANLASEAMEIQDLLRDAPRKISDTLALLAENKVQFRLVGLEDSRLIENLQKIANRISAGVVTASLILASALMMRVETEAKLFGYPAVALVLFGMAVVLGLAIVVSSLRRDRNAKIHEERAPR